MNHLIHSCILALVLYGIYRLTLKGSAGFQWHRLYLLAIPIVAALLPLLVIPLGQNFFEGNTFMTPEVLPIDPVVLDKSQALATSPANPDPIDIISIIVVIYLTGVGISFLTFLYKMASIYQFKDQGKTIYHDGFYITRVHNLPTAFSFLNHIYINEAFAGARYEQVLLHEITHIKERHSWDLLFYEILKILFWFHPVSYLAQVDLKMVHEHIADQQTIAVHGKRSYYENLLREVMDCPDFSFSNPFFKNKTVKTRLSMIQKSQKNKFPFRKLLWILPVFFASLIYTACTSENKNSELSIEEKMKPFEEGGVYADVTQNELELVRKIRENNYQIDDNDLIQNYTNLSIREKFRLTWANLDEKAESAIVVADSSILTKKHKPYEIDINNKLYEKMISTRFSEDYSEETLSAFLQSKKNNN